MRKISVIICTLLFVLFVFLAKEAWTMLEKHFTIIEQQNRELIQEIRTLKEEVQKKEQSDAKVTPKKSGYLMPTDAKPLQKWKGGKSFEYEEIYAAVAEVVDNFPKDVADRDGLIALVLETACIESDFGEIVKQKGGPALGILQMQPGTYRYLKKNASSEEKAFVEKFKDDNLNGLENLTYNVKYQVATCLLLYSSFGVHEKSLNSKNERARLYKKHWNTPKGKATPARFIKRANKHLSPYYL